MKTIQTLIFICLSTWSFGQNNTANKLAAYMQAQADVNDFSGVVLVTRNDSILLKQSYGFADYEWHVKNTTDTKFQLASVTKQFTAAAILILVEEGKLSLTDRLSQFYPDFPKADSVTIHMLLSHSSGQALGFKELALSTMHADSAYAAIKRMPYVFSPGTGSGYSNIGYYLLGKIIEQVSGDSYARFLNENIFKKVGMKNTGVSDNNTVVLHKARVYQRSETGFIHNPYINWQINRGHDGIYSNVEDLAAWDKALYGTSILSAKSKQIMFTAYNADSYGYGFLINPFYNHGHQLIAHDGGFFGTMTSFNRFTEDKIFITVLSNNESLSYLIAYGLSGILFEKDVELPYKHQAVKIDTRGYNKFVGNYENDIKILTRDNKLFYNSMETELIPESETKFFRADNNERTIEFIQDKSGSYSRIIVTKAGVKESYKRKRN
ncbi:serine hydrolase domain-containing protein [Polluticaenibacter yanchengensis]|uniref:Serine hydrolase n=1 Tax=Polluticaenibacter yanchengensis TaxID=3014562 RepID=A0ABT4UP91_9BACT|nr:serine hydrolase [Chitinophagaceae bacterium LY-5]